MVLHIFQRKNKKAFTQNDNLLQYSKNTLREKSDCNKYAIDKGAVLMNKVEICGVNTSKLPTLSKAEKDELFVKIKQGDADARDKFVNGNLRLVLSVIQRFNNRGENSDDLFQVGCIGLIKAIDNFDLSQNVQFSTYAVPMNVPCRKKLYF